MAVPGASDTLRVRGLRTVPTIALGSVRSCGVTTAATLLAALWPKDRQVLLAELDPAGGTLAARAGWAAEPNLVSLAAASRHEANPGVIWQHCHSLPDGAPVLAAPPSPEQARTALAIVVRKVDFNALDGDVLADCGRLTSTPESTSVMDSAELMLLFTRPQLSDLCAVTEWLSTNRRADDRLSLVLSGRGPYTAPEIEDALGVHVIGTLPDDPSAAEAVAATSISSRLLSHAPVVRAARSLAAVLVDRLVGLATESETEDTELQRDIAVQALDAPPPPSPVGRFSWQRLANAGRVRT